MGDNKGYLATDLVDHKYSRLTDITEDKYVRPPAYAETIEVSTSEAVTTGDRNECLMGGEAVKKEVPRYKEYLQCNDIPGSSSVIQIKLESVVDGCQTETVKNESPLEDSGAYKTNEVDVGGMSEAVRVILKSEASKYGELKCDLKPGEFINIETGEEALSSGVTSYQIDYSNIKSFVLCEPIIFYHFGNISLKCTKVNKKVFVKPFECSTLGLGDKEALANIQNFINSNECIRRLAVVEKLDSTNISEFIAEEPRLTRMSDEYVRLVCTYEGGRTITKVFPGTELGIKDPVTRKTVQEFIDSEEGRNWIMKGFKRKRGDWVKLGEIAAGTDTKKFISNIKFDVNQRFIYEKKFLEIVRDEDVLPASISSHANWGSSHRADDRFKLKVPPDTVAGTVLARFHLECASLTDKCKTECGAPISDVTIINGKFSCCGKVKETQLCRNCGIDNTVQWYKIEKNTTICNSCYKFYQRRGVHRPYCRKNNRKKKIHETHTKCNWRMKLELSGYDITKWIVYQHSNNSEKHNVEVPCQTRPTLMMRDKWDKLRSLAKLTPKQILLSETQVNAMPKLKSKMDWSTFQSIKTRANLIDNRKKNSLISVKDGIPISVHRKLNRITIERYFEHIIFLQRKGGNGNREYHLVISSADSIENLSELEIPVEGHGEQAKFKSGIIVVYYDPYEGVAAAFLISCMEGGLGLAISHELTFKVTGTDDRWSSVLQKERCSEQKYDFKPAYVKLEDHSHVKVTKKCQDSQSGSVFNFSNILDLVGEKPKLVKISDVRVRLQCLLQDGRLLTKVFPSTSEGIHKLETHKTIQEFIDSQECREWIISKGVENWIRIGEVATGTDTEQYLCHAIKSEVMQRFFYRKNILEIIPDGNNMLSAMNKSKSSHIRPGIHKVGNKFALKVSPEEAGNKVVATMYLDCASTSENCKTKCGQPVNEVCVVDGVFSCCGTPKEQIRICCNCYTDNSDRWSKLVEDSFLCHTCHNYYRKKNQHRPPNMSKSKRKKIHESHVKCEWKMKLELRGSDITRWQIYKHHLNKEAHGPKPNLSRNKRKAEQCKEERTPKRMKLFSDGELPFPIKESTRIIKAFPRFAAGSGAGRNFEHSEKPDENGFLMYPEIKEYITGLVLRDIFSPKEIRHFVSHYACENFLVSESSDSKCSPQTIYELRTLVKGFIYYVQSDIYALSKSQESKKLMICLGNGYPTLYFVQDEETQVLTENIEVVEVEDGSGINGNLESSETIDLEEKPNGEIAVRVRKCCEGNSIENVKASEVPLKIFVTTRNK
ncbi:uncharacterized protein LOC135209590 [Macrobrachium nipponense]|uniref:uncharacterized protein LOC135209590 n=1 Tax=Macrobrachium nipponense TaxID=159736 RepID=UPI0030C81E8B